MTPFTLNLWFDPHLTHFIDSPGFLVPRPINRLSFVLPTIPLLTLPIQYLWFELQLHHLNSSYVSCSCLFPRTHRRLSFVIVIGVPLRQFLHHFRFVVSPGLDYILVDFLANGLCNSILHPLC